MDIDDLKKQWHSVDVPDAGIREVEREVTSGRNALTLRDRLMLISRRQALVCVAGALCMLPLGATHPVMTLLAVAFFAIMGVMHMLQLRRLRALNLSCSTVREALAGVLAIETLRTVRRIIGITMAVPLGVGLIFAVTRAYGPLMFPACMAGLLAGCVVAFAVNRRSTRLLVEIKKALAEDFSAS